MGLWSGRSREEWGGGGTSYGFESKKDPRFKGGGTAPGVFSAHDQINKDIEALEKKLGCEAPDDIEIWANKD